MQNEDSIPNQLVQPVAVRDEGNIQALIKTIRGVQVMLDRDLAKLYGVKTGALNRQVKRNEERFPEDFMFRLSAEEWDNSKCQFGISSWGDDRQLPYFTSEHYDKNHVPRHKISEADIKTFNAQYPKLAVRRLRRKLMTKTKAIT